jgi:glycosyltransferase involved in cell wall biosynthesis
MNATNPPLISVIIPTFNHANFLGRAIQSVLDQTYTFWEAIIIDNHSTDNTDDIMMGFNDPRITFLKIHNNGVIAASRNAGIRAAKGEWIALLDSDDWWMMNKLQVCLDNTNDKVDLVHHDLEIVTNNPRYYQRKKTKSWQLKSPVLVDLLLNGNAIVNSSVFVRKRVLQQIGGINESVEMIAAEDYNAWLRIAQLTEGFVYVSCTLGYYLIHDQSISQKDMSQSSRIAVAEFVPGLSEPQKLKLEASFRYTTGRYNYYTDDFVKARESLLFSMKWGDSILKIKSAVFLLLTLKGRKNS